MTPSTACEHPFEVDPRDHAETPFEAYRNIAPLLRALARRLYPITAEADVNADADASDSDPDGGDSDGNGNGGADDAAASRQLRIYDPYFCEGSMVAYLARLGFTNVYNRNEDFYAVVAAGRVPDFDVLVTNPPFSGDHMERIVRWAEGCGRPWFLLMPDFVANKPYYHAFRHRCATAVASARMPIYVGPTQQAYVFAAPLHTHDGITPLVDQRPSTSVVPLRSKATSVAADDDDGRDQSVDDGAVQVLPAGCFQCVWFVQLGETHAEAVLEQWNATAAAEADAMGRAEATIASEAKLLPQLTIAKRPTPAERRWRKKQRRLEQSTGTGGADQRQEGGHQGTESETAVAPATGRRGVATAPESGRGRGRGHQRNHRVDRQGGGSDGADRSGKPEAVQRKRKAVAKAGYHQHQRSGKSTAATRSAAVPLQQSVTNNKRRKRGTPH